MKIGYIQQNGTPFDWDGSLIQVGQLQQGMDTDNRIGNEVFLHRVTFKGSFSQSQAGDDNTIKVALILYRGSPPAIPLASTFFTNTGTVGAPIGFQQNVLDGSYRILYQKTFNLTDTYPIKMVDISSKLGVRARYNNAALGYPTNLYLALCIISDSDIQAANKPTFRYRCRYYYTDA